SRFHGRRIVQRIDIGGGFRNGRQVLQWIGQSLLRNRFNLRGGLIGGQGKGIHQWGEGIALGDLDRRRFRLSALWQSGVDSRFGPFFRGNDCRGGLLGSENLKRIHHLQQNHQHKAQRSRHGGECPSRSHVEN